MTLPDPNAQTPPPAGNDQTDYKAQYVQLSAQIASGEYVPKNTYTGLQQTHEKTVLAHKADKDALSALQQAKDAAETAAKNLTAQLETERAEKEKAAKELEVTKVTLERRTLVMKDFPDLAALEGEGLLPQATIAELPAILKTFQEKLGGMQQQQNQQKFAGANQPPAGKDSNVNQTAKQLLDEANTLVRQGKFAEYNVKLNEYYKATGVAAK